MLRFGCSFTPPEVDQNDVFSLFVCLFFFFLWILVNFFRHLKKIQDEICVSVLKCYVLYPQDLASLSLFLGGSSFGYGQVMEWIGCIIITRTLFADRVHVRLWPLSSQLVHALFVMNHWSKWSEYKTYSMSNFERVVRAKTWTSNQWLLTYTLSANRFAGGVSPVCVI